MMDEATPELADFTRRFWWTLPVTKRAGEGLTLVASTIAAQAGPAGQGTDRTWHRRHCSQAGKQASSQAGREGPGAG
jgi:hypothetical protein